MTKDNHLLGQFDLTGIPPAPRGTPQIDVTFAIDANGILTVAAEEKGTGKKEEITINNDDNRLTPEEIQNMISDAEKFAEEDQKIKDLATARNELESYAYSLKNTVADEEKLEGKLTADEIGQITEAASAAVEWMDNNVDADPADFKEKKAELEEVAGPLMAKIYGAGAGSAPPTDAEEDHDEL